MTYCYLIEAQNGLVKLGCSQYPNERLGACRTHSPILCRMIAIWPGNFLDESRLHKTYIAHRNHSEWFRLEGEFAAFVDSMRGQGVDAIDEWDSLIYHSMTRREYGKQKRSLAHKKNWADPKWRAERMEWIAEQARRRRAEKAGASA